MSMYTSYVVNARENLSRIRNPGCDTDGMSPERVIFSNPDNIYYGTLAGQLSSKGTSLNECTINDS